MQTTKPVQVQEVIFFLNAAITNSQGQRPPLLAELLATTLPLAVRFRLERMRVQAGQAIAPYVEQITAMEQAYAAQADEIMASEASDDDKKAAIDDLKVAHDAAIEEIKMQKLDFTAKLLPASQLATIDGEAAKLLNEPVVFGWLAPWIEDDLP